MAAGFKQATVNASDVPATLTNYVTYVDLSRLGITTLAEAQSVRVYSDSGKTTELAREIVNVSEMHVKVPSFTSSAVLYVDWDGISSDYAVTDTYGRNAVWSDYTAVYHFKENTGTSTENSTGGTDGTLTSSALWSASAPFGEAVSLEGDGTNYVSAIAPGALASYSITDWRLVHDPAGTQNAQFVGYGVQNNSTAFLLSYYDDGNAAASRQVEYERRTATNNLITRTGILDAWYHHAITSEKNTTGGFKTYYNASLESSVNTQNTDLLISTRPFYILARNNAGTAQTPALADNYISEWRLRQDILSADWLTTEYNNQVDESGFWGTWTDVGGGGANTTNFFAML